MTCGHPNPSSPLQGHLSPVPVIRPSHEPRTNSLFSDPPSPASESSRKDYETLSDSMQIQKEHLLLSKQCKYTTFFPPSKLFPQKNFPFLLPDTIKNANRPIAARMREASSFAPNGQRLPKHLKNRPQSSIPAPSSFSPRSLPALSSAHH